MSARPRARRRTAAATALALLGGIATLVTTDADRALAVVEHRSGFDATVLGWTSWYGSYGLGDQGLGWCIDHGLLAPDAAYGYVPVAPPMDERTGAAVSWVVATGELADRDPAVRARAQSLARTTFLVLPPEVDADEAFARAIASSSTWSTTSHPP